MLFPRLIPIDLGEKPPCTWSEFLIRWFSWIDYQCSYRGHSACLKWVRFLASIHFLQGALWLVIHTENSSIPEFSSVGMIGSHLLILNSLLIIYALRNQMQATFCNTVILDLALYRKGYFGDELMCHSSAKKGPFVLLLAQITGCKVNNGHFFRRKYSKFFKAPSRDASVIELTFLPSFPTSFLRLLYSRCLFFSSCMNNPSPLSLILFRALWFLPCYFGHNLLLFLSKTICEKTNGRPFYINIAV